MIKYGLRNDAVMIRSRLLLGKIKGCINKKAFCARVRKREEGRVDFRYVQKEK